MIHQCSVVLRNLRKLSTNTDTVLCFLGCTTYICRSDDEESFYDYSNYQGEIYAIIEQLVNDSYLKYEDNQYHFSLTESGLHPHQVNWIHFGIFLFKSVIVPIVVSFITTLLTAFFISG